MANKKYTDFTPGTPLGDRLILHADDTTGDLESATINELVLGNTPFDDIITAYRLLGSELIAQPLGKEILQYTAGVNMTSQRIFMQAVYLRSAQTITGAAFFQAVQGNYTANNHNGLALFSYSGGTLTQVASSTNNGNLWKGTANTIIKEPFSATYAAQPGIYFIQALYCSSAQVTAPALIVHPADFNIAQAQVDFTNSAKTNGIRSTQTAFTTPVAISNFNSQQQGVYLAIY